MRSIPLLVLLAAAGAVFAQQLSCPPAPNASGVCEVYHYHALLYRPDTRGFVEVYGINQYASQSACEHARDARMNRNLAVVDHMKRVVNDQQYQPDRFGPCHCDMTVERSSPNFLTGAQRVAQIRLAGEVRERVKERLLREGLTTDSELVRGLTAPPASNSFLGGPRMTPLPPAQVVTAVANLPGDLRMARPADNTGAPTASIDLPLVDVTSGELASAPPPAPSPPPPAPAMEAASPPSARVPPPAAELPETRVEEIPPPAEDSADAFISYETQRIQNVLKASGAIADESMKSKILEACMQRIQLLSNLRALIQGSGARSRLAMAARSARAEPERLALAAKLFGAGLTPHWAPRNAADVILPPMADVDADPEKVLRDGSNQFSDQQKRRALYILLSHSQPTEEQQLWLTTVVDAFLQ